MAIHSLSVASAALALLAALGECQNITNDAYFYGQSPPVYPTPQSNGTGDWAAAYAKAKALVAKLTIDEKSNLTYGTTTTTGCSGQIPAIPRVGFPGLCLSDAGNGVRATDFVNAYPAGLHVGAAWSRGLAYQRAGAMGHEFRVKGVNVALGPVVGPLGAIALGGRNWEGFSNDPYLCGQLAFETVRGIQEQGVITSLKHYIGNEQETNRNPAVNRYNESTQSLSIQIDDKTLHELFLWPFQDGLKAGTGNIMCSYNRINNSYGCQNSKLLNGVLKEELGFQGFVVTDWFALHGGVAAAEAGLDMSMPNAVGLWGSNLTQGIANGTMPESRLTDMATRIIAAWYFTGQDQGFPEPGIGMPTYLTQPHNIVNARTAAARPILLQGAVEGHVLVKNVNNALPLKSANLRGIAIYGYDATAPPTMNPPGPPMSASIADVFKPWVLGFSSDPEGINAFLPGFIGVYTPIPAPRIAPNGTVWCGGGSGGNSPAYISSPFDAILDRARRDGTGVNWDFTSENPTVPYGTDACLVFLNAWASEGADRAALEDDFSDNLVNNVAAKCNNTIVVIHNAGIRLVDGFQSNPNVTAIIYAHLPGQDSGPAVTQILYGHQNPSGKLPYTVAKKASDYGRLLEPVQPEGIYTIYPQDNFTSGVYIDYRAFDRDNIEPRYEFGYGLSYTTFEYSSLVIKLNTSASTAEYPPVSPILQGGVASLFDTLYHVSAGVTNTGAYDGVEVAQLYIGIKGGPIRQLRGFDKISVDKGKTVNAQFDLTRRDLSEWDVVAQKWRLQRGTYQVYVGSSSRKLPLTGTITI